MRTFINAIVELLMICMMCGFIALAYLWAFSMGYNAAQKDCHSSTLPPPGYDTPPAK